MTRRVGADHEGLLASMADEVSQWCVRKGWREPGDFSTPDNLGRTFGDEIALMHSELSEALEAYRIHGLADATYLEAQRLGTPEFDIPKPEGVASELADLLIRLLDTCAHLRIDLFAEYRRKMDYNETREHKHGGKRL